jgi:hypothetical protein
MLLAGIDMTTELVAVLISMLRDECYFRAADTLEHALEHDQREVGLTLRERTAILDVLDDPPAGLELLRAVLEAEYVWRGRERLAPGRRF